MQHHAFVRKGRELDTFSAGWGVVDKPPVEQRSFATDEADRVAAAAIEEMRASVRRAQDHVRQLRRLLTNSADEPLAPTEPQAKPPRPGRRTRPQGPTP